MAVLKRGFAMTKGSKREANGLMEGIKIYARRFKDINKKNSAFAMTGGGLKNFYA